MSELIVTHSDITYIQSAAAAAAPMVASAAPMVAAASAAPMVASAAPMVASAASAAAGSEEEAVLVFVGIYDRIRSFYAKPIPFELCDRIDSNTPPSTYCKSYVERIFSNLYEMSRTSRIRSSYKFIQNIKLVYTPVEKLEFTKLELEMESDSRSYFFGRHRAFGEISVPTYSPDATFLHRKHRLELVKETLPQINCLDGVEFSASYGEQIGWEHSRTLSEINPDEPIVTELARSGRLHNLVFLISKNEINPIDLFVKDSHGFTVIHYLLSHTSETSPNPIYLLRTILNKLGFIVSGLLCSILPTPGTVRRFQNMIEVCDFYRGQHNPLFYSWSLIVNQFIRFSIKESWHLSMYYAAKLSTKTEDYLQVLCCLDEPSHEINLDFIKRIFLIRQDRAL